MLLWRVVLVCTWRWVRSQRSWRPTSTWSSRSAAASCLSPAPAVLGSGDRNQPVGLRRWNYQREKKSLCWTRKHEHTSEKGRARNTELWKQPDYSLFGETCSHQAQQILQSCDVNPPLMLASPLLAFSLPSQILLSFILLKYVHLLVFPMNTLRVCAPCYCFPTFLIS